jgi:hypothetical protein
MNYKKKMKDALGSLGVPVEFKKYSGAQTTYITFDLINEQGEEWAENEEIATGYVIRVNIYSKSDYTTLEGQVKSTMKTAGFTRQGVQDFYESETGFYHLTISFSYTELI